MSTEQNRFLDSLIQAKTNVSIYLIGGIRLKGQILRHDQYTIFLTQNNQMQMCYKHSISTVVPEGESDGRR